MKNRFRITLSTYSATLALVSTLIAIFGAYFFRGYFNPNFIAEYRATASVSTVLGFINGINPFQEEYIEMYGNGYSVLWPGMNYLIARLFGLVSYDQIKILMYALNAVIVIGTAAAAFYIGLRNKLNALHALTISFTYFLLNSTNISMGEFSYSAGLSCVFFALVLAGNKFDKFGLCMALALISLASLFKIYFALLGIVIVLNWASLLSFRILISILCVWGIATVCLFFGLTRAFPFYFDSIYFLQKMHQSWNPVHIVVNILWFLPRFGFIFILALPQLFQFKHFANEEKRRRKLYAVGSAIVCAYVVFVMLPHVGNTGTYLLHIVAPMILAYALSRREEFEPKIYRRTDQIAALTMCLMVLIDPTFRSSPLHHWQVYGVLSSDVLNFNRSVLTEVDEIIRSSAGKKIYVAPMLAPLAIKRQLAYVDNGFQEYYTAYINARIKGTFEPSPLIGWLAARKPEGPERTSTADVLESSDVVICMLDCPSERTHQFVRSLGPLTSAFNGPIEVKLYYIALRPLAFAKL